LSNIKTKVEEIAKPVVESLGYEYVDTEFAKQGKDWILTITIDSKSGIGIEDCEKVSRTVEPLLDEKDFIEQHYYLCVSSIGLDRPLKTMRDFERSMGKSVDIKLYRPVDGQKEYSGQIIGYSKETIEIRTADGANVAIDLKEAAKISLHIDY